MAQRSNQMNLSATKPFASWTWNALGVWRVYPRLRLGMSWCTWPDAPAGKSRAAAGLPQTHLVPQSLQNHWEASQSLESKQMKSPVLRAWHQSKLSSGNKQFSLTRVSSFCSHHPPSRKFLLWLVLPLCAQAASHSHYYTAVLTLLNIPGWLVPERRATGWRWVPVLGHSCWVIWKKKKKKSLLMSLCNRV